MSRSKLWFLILSVVLISGVPAAHADLKVVATVPDLAALAQVVGGRHVSVKSMTLPTQDPHFADAKPSLVVDLSKADLLIAVGLELEIGWLPTLQTGARNPAILTSGRGFLDCSLFVKVLDVATGPIDRSAGDIHPSGNPHWFHDPRAALACARGIAAKMIELDPGSEKGYRAGLKAFSDQLGAAMAGWEKRLAPVRGKIVLTYHKSWNYLIDWVGLRALATIEPKPGIPPNPRYVAKLIEIASKRDVAGVLQETYYPEGTAGMVADELGAPLIRLPAGTRFGRETYIQHIERIVAALEKGLAD